MPGGEVNDKDYSNPNWLFLGLYSLPGGEWFDFNFFPSRRLSNIDKYC